MQRTGPFVRCDPTASKRKGRARSRLHTPPRVRAVIALAALAAGVGLATALPVAAQLPAADPDPGPGVARLEAELAAARRDHLARVGWWGAANLAAGIGLAATASGAPTRRGFGVQTAAWGAINLGIVAWAHLAGPPEPSGTLVGALAAEDAWSHVLLVNLGLNVGYMAVGGALWAASNRGLASGDAVRGHAVAVVLQGAGLLVLDGIAWLSSSGRLDGLREVVASLAASTGPAAEAVSFGVRLPFH